MTAQLSRRQRFVLMAVPAPAAAGVIVAGAIAAGQLSIPLGLRAAAAVLCAWPVLWAAGRCVASARRLRRTELLTMLLGSIALAAISYGATLGGAYLAVWLWLVVADEQVRLASVAVLTIVGMIAKLLTLGWRRLGERG